MRSVGLVKSVEGWWRVCLCCRRAKEFKMTHISNRMQLPESRLNDAVIGALQVSILVLAGIISLAQFAC